MRIPGSLIRIPNFASLLSRAALIKCGYSDLWKFNRNKLRLVRAVRYAKAYLGIKADILICFSFIMHPLPLYIGGRGCPKRPVKGSKGMHEALSGGLAK
jgi:hypothetical protein